MTDYRDDLPRFTELEAEYEILRELGRGGTAVVYLARDRELGRSVAIKVIRSTYIDDEEAAARLAREARTVGGLQHPNIVMLYGTRRLRDRSLALVMQYVAGRTLKSEISARGPLPFDQIDRVLSDLGCALAYAHRNRIVHRDIKPENIYLDDESGIARLSDFGIARSWDRGSNLTLPGTALGTPAYMSPEQIDGGVVDGRSDLYSLGLVGYEMVTGETPWGGENLFGIIYKQKHEKLPSLSAVRPGVPEALRIAIEGALHKDPARRWADASEFLGALGGVITAPAAPAAMPTVAVADAIALHAPEPTPVRTADPENVTVALRRQDWEGPPKGGFASFELVTAGADDGLASPVSAPQPVHAAPAPVARRSRGRDLLVAGVTSLVLAGGIATVAMTQQPNVVIGPEAVPAVVAAAEAPPPVPAGEPGVAVRARTLSGAVQRGFAGDTLAEPLALVIEDAAGRPVPGVVVRFAVVGGVGALTADSVVTDAQGVAAAGWVPAEPGQHDAQATIAALDAAAYTFRATALPRPELAHLSASSDTEMRGAAGERIPLAVLVQDDRGQPAADVEVRFEVQSGGGRLDPATPTTNADGLARTEWVLGASGPQEVGASVEELDGEPIVFRATIPPRPLAVRSALAAGGTHTCSIDRDGIAMCWGGNANGQLGDGSMVRRAVPTRVVADEPFAVLSAGVSHTCAITVSRSAWCWGANASGQLGSGGTGSSMQPARVASDEAFIAIAAGMTHSCGLDGAGQLFCWGENTHGQLGDGTRTDRRAPVRAGGGRTFRSVTLGWAHTCALAGDGTAYCWGRNSSGELGDGGTADRTAPVAVNGGHAFSTIAAGSAHTCGLRGDGTVLCWGQNTNGQLGNGSTTNSSTPVAVVSDVPFGALAVGGVHACALARNGAAQCWGRNMYGQLGDGTTQDRARPTPVAGAHRFTALSASGAHTCGASETGRLCWGFNIEGQLGDGTRTNQPRPVAVVRPW